MTLVIISDCGHKEHIYFKWLIESVQAQHKRPHKRALLNGHKVQVVIRNVMAHGTNARKTLACVVE